MKKKLFCVGLATAVALCSAVPVGAKYHISTHDKSINNSDAPSSIALCTETFDSVDEIMNNTDANIISTVISQSIEDRCGIKFTHSYVQTDLGKIYDVLQTGAIVNGKPVNILNDTPLLELNETYFLSLDQTEYHENYGQYYLIVGGNQGYGLYDSNDEIVMSLSSGERAVYSSMQVFQEMDEIEVYNVSTDIINPISSTGFNPEDYIWESTNIRYTLTDYIETHYGSSVARDITDGAESWNGYCDIQLTESSSNPSVGIFVFMDDVGKTGWVGLTIDYDYYVLDDPSQYFTDVRYGFESVHIRLNSFYTDPENEDAADIDDIPNFWQAIACHEFGHAIGLKHLGIVDAENIMQSEIFLTLKEQKENSPITPYNCGQICGGTCDVHQMTNKYS